MENIVMTEDDFKKERSDHIKVRDKLLEVAKWAEEQHITPVTACNVMLLFALELMKEYNSNTLTKEAFLKTMSDLWDNNPEYI